MGKETRPEEALTQGTTIRGVRDLAGFWQTGRRLLLCPAEQVPGDNSFAAGEIRSGVKENIISKETSLLSQNQIKLLKTQKQITWGLLGGPAVCAPSCAGQGRRGPAR